MSDLLKSLRRFICLNRMILDEEGDYCDFEEVVFIVEKLQKALRLACGELSTYGAHINKHPEQVYEEILAEVEKINKENDDD